MAPEFPQYDAKVAAGLEGAADAAGGLGGFLGIRHTEVGPGRLRAEVDVRDELMTPFGNLHGGVLAALCDHVLGTVLYPVIARGAWAATTEFKINYLAPITTGTLDRDRRDRVADEAHGSRAHRRRERGPARLRGTGHCARDGTQGLTRQGADGLNTPWTGGGRRPRRPCRARRSSASSKPTTSAGEVGERVAAGREQVERGAVGGGVDAEGAEDAQLLEHDEVGPEARRLGRAPGAGHDDRCRRSARRRWPGPSAAGALAVTSTTTSASAAGRLAQRVDRVGARRRRRRGRRRSSAAAASALVVARRRRR